MTKGIRMTVEQARAHQERHGFSQPSKNGQSKPSTPKGKLRRQREPNQTERDFGLVLAAMQQRGEIDSYFYERYTLVLGDRCRYTPDYAVVRQDNTVAFYEVKGRFIFSRALVKPRAAATQFPQHKFVIAQKIKGEWRLDEIESR